MIVTQGTIELYAADTVQKKDITNQTTDSSIDMTVRWSSGVETDGMIEPPSQGHKMHSRKITRRHLLESVVLVSISFVKYQPSNVQSTVYRISGTILSTIAFHTALVMMSHPWIIIKYPLSARTISSSPFVLFALTLQVARWERPQNDGSWRSASTPGVWWGHLCLSCERWMKAASFGQSVFVLHYISWRLAAIFLTVWS